MRLENFIKKFIFRSDTKFEICIDHDYVVKDPQKYLNAKVEGIDLRDGNIRIYVNLMDCYFDPKTETYVRSSTVIKYRKRD